MSQNATKHRRGQLLDLFKDREATKEYWEQDWSSRDYEKMVCFELYNHTFKATVDSFIEQSKIEGSSRVLDIGCGYGRIIIGLLKQIPQLDITGIDVSAQAISKAPAIIEHETGVSNVDLRVANAEELPFKSESFDSIVSTRAFQYITDPQKAMHEVSRVLKPNGHVTIIVPNKLNPIRYLSYHTQLLTCDDIAQWMSKCNLRNISKGTIVFFPPRLKRFSEHSLWVSVDRFLAKAPGINRFGGLALASAEKI